MIDGMMIEGIWYAVVAIACVVALADWRTGIYVGLALDCLRDPVRKATPDQSVLITLAGAGIWGVVILRALLDHPHLLRELMGRYPTLRGMAQCLLLAIIPAALLSMLLYSGGWKLAAIGCVSYLAPLLGIGLGYLFPRHGEDVYRMMRFYSLVNSIVLIGVPLEYAGFDWPVLGGVQADWIRYRTGYIVELYCGFYRSPDIMGLHAAHVTMFSILLGIRAKYLRRASWGGIALWALFCVFLSGRRKMIGIPMVFAAAYIMFGRLRGIRRARQIINVTVIGALLAGAMTLVVWSPDEAQEHSDYAMTLFTEGATRANEIIVGSSISTLQQSGVLGAGIGTATQGRYYIKGVSGQGLRTWQEDGVSRLLLEFGVPGFLLLGVAALLMCLTLRRSMYLLPRDSSEQLLQLGLLSIVIGDVASYAISHQQFSGDPVNGLLVTMFAGMVLGLPRAFAMRQQQAARRRVLRNPEPVPKAARAIG